MDEIFYEHYESYRGTVTMEQFKEKFVKEVCEKVSFKEVHSVIREELMMHMDDCIDECLEEGMSKEETLKKIRECIGSSEEIGEQFDRIYKHNINWPVLIAALILTGIGIILNYTLGEWSYGSGKIFAMRQSLGLVMGISVMVIIYISDYRKLQKYSHILYCISLIISIYTYIFGIKIGDSMFISVGSITFMPYSFCNIIFIISIFDYMMKLKDSMWGIIKLSLYVIVALGCTYVSADRGTYVVMMIVCFGILFMGIIKTHVMVKSKITYLITIGSIIAIIVVRDIKTQSIQMIQKDVLSGRFINFPDHWWKYESSMLHAIIGVVGIGLLVILLPVIVGVIASNLNKCNNSMAYYFTWILSIYIMSKFALGIISGCGYFENMFVSIPFISYGGSSLIADYILVGIFLSIWRRNSFIKDEFNITI